MPQPITDTDVMTASNRLGPPHVAGRSKRLWKLDADTCLIELVPSLRSYTHDRDELVEGTAELRLDFYEAAVRWVEDQNVPTAYLRRLDARRYLARFVAAPPIEVIVKNVAIGSTVRKYPGLFAEGHRFDAPVVKFDFRVDPEDEPIAEDYLREMGISVTRFKDIALRCNAALTDHLSPLDLWDFCLVIGLDSAGQPSVISEISPDCMRLKDASGRSLDKDLFRHGAEHADIRSAWRDLVERIS